MLYASSHAHIFKLEISKLFAAYPVLDKANVYTVYIVCVYIYLLIFLESNMWKQNDTWQHGIPWTSVNDTGIAFPIYEISGTILKFTLLRYDLLHGRVHFFAAPEARHLQLLPLTDM